VSTEANKISGMTASDTRRWVIFAQVVLAAAVWWALGNAFALVYRTTHLRQFTPFGVADSQWIAFALVGAAFIYTLRNAMAQEFANDVFNELRKVTWPSWKETRQSTLVVIVTVFVVGMILGGFDLMWAKLTRQILTGGQ
jgi:preprotein translocase SecE subunit